MEQLSREQKIEVYDKALLTAQKFFKKYDQIQYRLSFEARMASLSSIVKSSFKDLVFCGFYVVTQLQDLEGKQTNVLALEVGPYCSDILATPRIHHGMGQCGSCWEQQKTLVENDVSICKNYIACDAETQSEIVIPVYRTSQNMQNKICGAVWDIDSIHKDRFDEIDVKYLEQLAQLTYQ